MSRVLPLKALRYRSNVEAFDGSALPASIGRRATMLPRTENQKGASFHTATMPWRRTGVSDFELCSVNDAFDHGRPIHRWRKCDL